MSIMGINLALPTALQLAVTAMFDGFSLRFVKYIVGIINYGGIICASNLSPFFMFTIRINPQGRAEIPLSSLIGVGGWGLDE